jgi:hypothetical protein
VLEKSLRHQISIQSYNNRVLCNEAADENYSRVRSAMRNTNNVSQPASISNLRQRAVAMPQRMNDTSWIGYGLSLTILIVLASAFPTLNNMLAKSHVTTSTATFTTSSPSFRPSVRPSVRRVVPESTSFLASQGIDTSSTASAAQIATYGRQLQSFLNSTYVPAMGSPKDADPVVLRVKVSAGGNVSTFALLESSGYGDTDDYVVDKFINATLPYAPYVPGGGPAYKVTVRGADVKVAPIVSTTAKLAHK